MDSRDVGLDDRLQSLPDTDRPLVGIILNAMETKADRSGMKRSRLLDWSQTHANNTEELLETTRSLSHAVEALEREIKQTGEDIRKAHKSYKRSSRKQRHSLRGKGKAAKQ
jgi:hypothetical protein